MAATGDDEYEIPLRDQRYFGAGIKRKRVKFVPSNSTETSIQSLPTTPLQSVAETYLSIVLKNRKPDERATSAPPAQSGRDNGSRTYEDSLETGPAVAEDRSDATCDICHRPITTGEEARLHESSIAHQICLQHSHPPSHIDRSRKGLSVLREQGWDPDSRKGLGAEGGGILHPIKAKENPEKAGLGLKYKKALPVEKPVKLDAGKVRLMEKEGKKKAERLRNAFYRSEEVERYLGGDGEVNANLDLAAFKRAKRR